MQSGQLITGSLREDFHRPVVIITDPTGDAEDVRFAFDEPAEADSLDASADYVAAGLNRLFGRSHRSTECRS